MWFTFASLILTIIFQGVVWAGAVCEPAPAFWRNHRSDECAGAATTAATAASTAATTAAGEETEAQVRVHRRWWEKCALRQPSQPWSFTGNAKPGWGGGGATTTCGIYLTVYQVHKLMLLCLCFLNISVSPFDALIAVRLALYFIKFFRPYLQFSYFGPFLPDRIAK